MLKIVIYSFSITDEKHLNLIQYDYKDLYLYKEYNIILIWVIH